VTIARYLACISLTLSTGARNALFHCSIVVAFAGLAAPQAADAACIITAAGTVNCNTNTITTNTTNYNGNTSPSSDRQQLFDRRVGVIGKIQPGVSLSGYGLQLAQGAARPLPIVINNQGLVTTNNAANALELDGNGGPVRYIGKGNVATTLNGGTALFIKNNGGNVSIANRGGAISGDAGIIASTTGTGALTIKTGSGSVSSTATDAILASTINGPLSLTIGSGGVTTDGQGHAIEVTSNDGDILVNAHGNVSGYFSCTAPECFTGGVGAGSTGRGNIVITGSGTYSSSGGRAIYAYQSPTGRGGILITGSGSTLNGIKGFANAGSAIRAEISNPADSKNIVIDRSGDITSANTFSATRPLLSISADIHAFTFGTGDIRVATGAGAILSNAGIFGIDVYEQGQGSTGSINISTGAVSKLTAGGTGIFATNWATAIPAAADSKIKVTANGTINSGAIPNTVGLPTEGAGSTATPAGIVAGYNGGLVFSSASAPSTAPYTSCRPIGCTTLTPNPSVNGTVSVINHAEINAAGGDGIFAFNFGNGNVSVKSNGPITVSGPTAQNGIQAFIAERGNISVSTMANIIAGYGYGIQTTNDGMGKTTIKLLAGTTQGATSGVAADSTKGTIRIDNSGTIQNSSGQAGDAAVVTSGTRRTNLTNNAGAIIAGTVSMTGTGINNFANSGIWNTLGANTFGLASSLVSSGAINVFGPTTLSGVAALTNRGVLNLAAGNTAGTLTMPGNLVFQAGAHSIVAVNATASAKIDVGGTALLAGPVQAVLLPTPFSRETTIVHSAGLDGTTFSGFTAPVGFNGTLAYTPTDVVSDLTTNFGTGITLPTNQQNVATTINKSFNGGDTLPGALAPVFSLAGPNLANALSQLSGEVAADAPRAGFQIMTEFLGIMLDPFVDGRLGSGASGLGSHPMSFAPDEGSSLPPRIALAYAGVLKEPPTTFDRRWTEWGSSYGGSNWTSGNANVGSSNVSTEAYGFAGGLDYHLSPDTIFGFALGAGGTAWGLSGGLGTGTSDVFQIGVYGITRSGPAYLADSVAFANHWITTNRAATGDTLMASFDAQSYGARVEGGYRFAALPTLGLTPYAAVQAQDFHIPSYGETDLTGGDLGLSYAAMNATDVRSEVGARFDSPEVIGGMPLLLRARIAWAHDWVSNPPLSAAFESLPGDNFVVNGAPIPQNTALTQQGRSSTSVRGLRFSPSSMANLRPIRKPMPAPARSVICGNDLGIER
jgi:uncharacterized protein with beta-barrel porin domain